jgi:hypothetical protein
LCASRAMSIMHLSDRADLTICGSQEIHVLSEVGYRVSAW